MPVSVFTDKNSMLCGEAAAELAMALIYDVIYIA